MIDKCNSTSRALLARGALLSLALGMGMLLAPKAIAETWAERLGYPTGAKVVLLHASELGMSFETNAAGTKLLEADLIRSASAMAPCAWYVDLAPWRRSHSSADLGLTLTLNSELTNYRWRPVAHNRLVASLRDIDGFFWTSPVQVMANATTDDVEEELTAQIAFARQQGMNPTHLTTHLGALVTRPDLIAVYLDIARRSWIPAVLVELTPEHLVRFEEQGFPLPEDIIELLSDYPLPKIDDMRFVAPAESYDAKKQAFLTMLAELEPGITQVNLRPAVDSEALRRITPDWQQRVWEAQLLQDQEVAGALKDKQFIFTNWREIMGRFDGRRQAPAESSATETAP